MPPVATYVDDTPLFVNLRLQDLDRVEVLRGPQGTLYGSGSLGGTIRFVQNAPDPSGFDAKAEAGVSETEHTHAPNEDVSGMLNLPLSDTFAVRMNAGWSDDAGFINQPNLYALDSSGVPIAAQPGNLFSPPETYAKDGTNSYDYRYARVAALWKPNDEFHAQLSYYYQLSTADGFPYASTSTAAYNQPISPALQPSGNFSNPALATQLFNAPVPAGVDSLSNAQNSLNVTNDEVDLVALTLEYDMGFATLTSASSWAHHTNQTTPMRPRSTSTSPSIRASTARIRAPSSRGSSSSTTSRGRRSCAWLPRPAACSTGSAGFSTRTRQTDDPGTRVLSRLPRLLQCLRSRSMVKAAATASTPSYCGVGETAYTPGATNTIDGIPIIKDQAYIGDFETKFKDLAAFGELTWHLTSDVERDRRHAAVQADGLAGSADRAAVRRRCVASDPWCPSPILVERFMAKGALEGQYRLSARQDQSRVRDLVAGIPARRRECVAAQRTRELM